MMVIQEVQRFPNHIDTSAIAESMNGRIDKGWRVHSCLVRGAEVIIVYERNEEARDSIICLEKACDELKEALKKKDAEIEKLNRENDALIKLSCNNDPLQWCGKMCGVAMDFADTAMDSAMDEIIQIMTDRILSYKTGIYINGEELIIIPMSDYNEILKELEDDAE